MENGAIHSLFTIIGNIITSTQMNLPSRSSLAFFLRLLPVHRFLRSPVVCWHVLSSSSTRHRSPPTRWRLWCGGKTTKFMVPIKNQNICSTTSSVRFSWIKFGLRQRSWQHQHSDYISPSPAAMIYVHFIEKHTIHPQLRSNDHPLLFRPKKPHTPL